MRINKTIKGQKFRFNVTLISNSMTAYVRNYISTEEPVIGVVSEDFTHIELPEDFLSPYITDYGRIPVGKLKLSKSQSWEAKDLNPNIVSTEPAKNATASIITLTSGIVIRDNRIISCGISIENQNTKYMSMCYSSGIGFYLNMTGFWLTLENWEEYHRELEMLRISLLEATKLIAE